MLKAPPHHNPVREWVCTRCGVRIKGVSVNGQVKATHRPFTPGAEARACLCETCADRS